MANVRLHRVRLFSPIGDSNNGGYFHRSVIINRATIITERWAVLLSSEYGSIKILPVTLNWTLSEKFNAIANPNPKYEKTTIPNPNPNPNPNPIIEQNTTIYGAKTYISGSKSAGQGVGATKAYSREAIEILLPEAIEDILSGTKGVKQGLGWVTYLKFLT